jgi:hypothetical protein
MAAKRGPTSNKRMRERSRDERRVKKEQRRLQREQDKKNGIVRVEEPEDSPPEEVAQAV